MFDFISERWYMVTSAFSSEPWYALLMSLPFIFFFSLFIICFSFCCILIYEENQPNEPTVQYSRGTFVGAIIILFTIFLIFPTLFSIPTMNNIDLKPQYLPPLVNKIMQNNFKQIENNEDFAYLELQGEYFTNPSQDFIHFKKDLLNLTAQNTILTQGQVSSMLQKNFISCIKEQTVPVYVKDNNFNNIKNDIDSKKHLCAIKAGDKIINDITINPSLFNKTK